jgi:hypothetical protein
MKVFKICLAVFLLAAASSGCTKQGSQRVTDPTPIPRPGMPQIREGRWITVESEIREVAARAAKSPLMERAIAEGVDDPRLSLLRSGIVGAVGTGEDGTTVRFTVLPYQYSDDITHARYFALVERGGASRVESFELIRNRHPHPDEVGFEQVNGGEHGLWMKIGPSYAQSAAGVVHRSPEKFNVAKFGTCFIMASDRGLGMVRDACHSMGDFPGCVTVGSGAVLAGAALGCAWVAWNG